MNILESQSTQRECSNIIIFQMIVIKTLFNNVQLWVQDQFTLQQYLMCMTRIITGLNMQWDLAKSFLLLQVYTRGWHVAFI